jgi:trimeric autotransporter adhesin
VSVPPHSKKARAILAPSFPPPLTPSPPPPPPSSNLGLPLGDDAFIDINASQSDRGGAGAGSLPGSSARRKKTDEIRLDGRGGYGVGGGLIQEMTEEDDDFDVPGYGGGGGQASQQRGGGALGVSGKRQRTSGAWGADDIEVVRRADETPANAGSGARPGGRASLSAGLTGSTVDRDDDRGSVVSDMDDSVRRHRRDGPAAEAGAARRKASLAAAAAAADDDDRYGLGEYLGGDALGADFGVDAGAGLGGSSSSSSGPFGDSEAEDEEGEGRGADGSSSSAAAAAAAAAATKAAKTAAVAKAAGIRVAPSAEEVLAASAQDVKAVEQYAIAQEGIRTQRSIKSAANRGKVLKEDSSVSISGDTMKMWLSDTSDLVAPRLRGDAALAHIHRTLEKARNAKLVAASKGTKTGGSVFPTTGAATSLALTHLAGSSGISTGVWSLASRGTAAAASSSSSDPAVQSAANRLALLAGSTAASITAARARNILGLPTGGMGDLTEDGDLVFHVPAVWDVEAEMARANVRSGSVIAPRLAGLLHTHVNGTAGYPESTSASAFAAATEAMAAEEEEAAAEEEQHQGRASRKRAAAAAAAVAASSSSSSSSERLGYADDDGNAYGEDPGYDAELAGAGLGANGAVDEMEWREDGGGNTSGLHGVTPDVRSNKTPGTFGSGAAASAAAAGASAKPGRVSILDSVAAQRAAAAAAGGASPGFALGGAAFGVGDDDEEELDDDASAKAGAGASARGTMKVGGIAGAEVDKEKWHAHTVTMLHALASVMTGPAQAGAPPKTGSKKRKSTDADVASLAGLRDGGSLADVDRGKGTGADPLTFAELADGAHRRAAAASFFQLLVLKSWDIVDVSQKAAYADISIARTVSGEGGSGG